MFSMILFCSAISVSVTVPSHLSVTPRSLAAFLAPLATVSQNSPGAFRDGGEGERLGVRCAGQSQCGHEQHEAKGKCLHTRKTRNDGGVIQPFCHRPGVDAPPFFVRSRAGQARAQFFLAAPREPRTIVSP